MATTVNMKGQKVIWGTSELGSPVNGGICVSGELEADGPDDDTENEDGQLIGITFYDERWNGSAEVVCKAGCSTPKIGDAVSFDGKTLYVKNCRKRWGNKAKKQLSITLKGGANIGG